MKIVAKTIKGKEEFMYEANTAYKVSRKSAKAICDVLNAHKFCLSSNIDEIWNVYDIDKYCKAYEYATEQSFSIRNGIVTETYHYTRRVN